MAPAPRVLSKILRAGQSRALMESRDKATKEGQNNGGIARNVTDGGRRGLKTVDGPAKKSGISLVRNGDKQKVLEKGHKA